MKVSVCIPVYNVERYIERCARSLFEQTIGEEIEYIFVDDCSSDGSVETLMDILSEYPARRDQVKIIRFPCNRGVAAARTAAVAAATGECVIHCDADDYVEPVMYEKMRETLLRERADVCCCGFAGGTSDGSCLNMKEGMLCDGLTFIRKYAPSEYFNSPVNKMYLKEVLNGLSYREDLRTGEDLVFNVQAMKKCRVVAQIPDSFYTYCRRATSSITSRRDAQIGNSIIRAAEYMGDELPDGCFSDVRDRMYRNALLAAIRYGIRDKSSYQILMGKITGKVAKDARYGLAKCLLLRISQVSYPLACFLARMLTGSR